MGIMAEPQCTKTWGRDRVMLRTQLQVTSYRAAANSFAFCVLLGSLKVASCCVLHFAAIVIHRTFLASSIDSQQ